MTMTDQRGDESLTPVRLRHRLQYAALRAAVALAGSLPLAWMSAIGAGVVGLIGPRLRQNRRALENLALAFPEEV